MKDKTAIEKMVEWLDNLRGFATRPEALEGIEIALKEARRLAAEEAKPTPPKEATAGLLTEIKKWWNVRPLRTSHGETIPDSPYKNVDEWSIAFSEIFCRYRPATPSEGLVGELRAFIGHAVINGFCSPSGAHKILDILSRHTGGKGVGVWHK